MVRKQKFTDKFQILFYCFKFCSAVSNSILLFQIRPLVKPGTPEQHQSRTRNTGTLKILDLLKTREKNTGGVELLLE